MLSWVLVILAFFPKPVSGQYILTTFAGTGTQGNSGDNGPATSADLNQATKSWVDSNGATFFVDNGAHVIRRVSTDGIITTIGGTGTSSNSNAGGAFTSVPLSKPSGITGDSTFLYISDFFHIWKYVRSSGIVSILAGTGTQGTFGNGGPATSSQVNSPAGLWLSTDNSLYIAEFSSNLVRKIVLSTNIISTIAGGGGFGFGGDGGPASSTNTKLSFPQGVYIDTKGVIFIADGGNKRIRYIVNGIINTYAGGGPSSNTADGFVGTNAYLPAYDVKGDTMGNIYVVGDSTVRIVDYATKAVTTYVTGLTVPRGIWLDKVNGRSVIGMTSYVKTAPLYVNPVPTASPTTAPFNPSPRPSGQPTWSPTRIPTAAPSSSPKPSEEPTHGPTSQPTTANPSFSPSTLPSRAPSSLLSNQPTLSPTVDTVKPTTAPSFSPTLNPTTVNPTLTLTPSTLPSREPAIKIDDVVQVSATSRVKFVYGQTLNQVSLDTLVSAFQNISDNAQSTAITSTVLVGQSSPQSVSVSGQPSYIYDIGFLSSYEMSYHAGYSSSELAVMKTTKVRRAIDVGGFESVLRNLAVVRNATQLLNASSSEVISLDSVIVPASSSSSKDDDSMSRGTVAGIVVGVLGGYLLVGIVLYVILKRRREQKFEEKAIEAII